MERQSFTELDKHTPYASPGPIIPILLGYHTYKVAYNLQILNHAVTGVFELRMFHLLRQRQAVRRPTAADNGIGTLLCNILRTVHS